MSAKLITTLIALAFVAGCGQTQPDRLDSLKSAARAYLSGVYCGDPSVIGDLVAEDIRVSYPIFEDLFGSPVVEGKPAVQSFAERFARKWQHPQLDFDQVIAEGNTVVVLWSFSATDSGAKSEESSAGGGRTSWGGITIIRFNEEGKVFREIGEESAPGPSARVSDTR